MKTTVTTRDMPGIITARLRGGIHQNILPRKSTEFVVISE